MEMAERVRADDVTEQLPEIEQITDDALRETVTRIWANAWASSVWTTLAEAPKSLDLPTRRTLVTHTRAVTRIAGHMADVLAESHDLTISRDKTLAIALLHDVSKLHEFEMGEEGPQASRTGRLYQHAYLAAHWMEQDGLDDDLVHGVLAHTPQSAVVPQTHEAVIVHYADFADS